MECVMLSTKYSLSYAITEVKSYICFSIIFYRKFPNYYMFNTFDITYKCAKHCFWVQVHFRHRYNSESSLLAVLENVPSYISVV